MVDRRNVVKTPAGATLGEKILIDGRPGLHYKAGKKEDNLTPEQIVECVTGRKVFQILYMGNESTEVAICR